MKFKKTKLFALTSALVLSLAVPVAASNGCNNPLGHSPIPDYSYSTGSYTHAYQTGTCHVTVTKTYLSGYCKYCSKTVSGPTLIDTTETHSLRH